MNIFLFVVHNQNKDGEIMIIRNTDLQGNPIDFQKIEDLILNNSVCNSIISQTLDAISKGMNDEQK